MTQFAATPLDTVRCLDKVPDQHLVHRQAGLQHGEDEHRGDQDAADAQCGAEGWSVHSIV